MDLKITNIRYAHSNGHTDVCYGSDKSNILTCGSDGNVRLWNGSNDDDPTADSVAEMTLAVACRKDQFFVGTDSNYVQAFTYPERKRDKIMFRFSAPVTHIAVSPSSKFLAAGSCDTEIQVLNMETDKITTLTGHKAPILGISMDPLDKYLASSSCDGTVKIWEIATGSLVKTFHSMLPVTNDFFNALCLGRTSWNNFGGGALAVPKDSQVIVFKRDTWEESFRLKSSKIEKTLSIVLFSSCGSFIAAASTGGEILIWALKHKSEVCYYKDPKKVGISGMVWGGDEIIVTDKLGRLGVFKDFFEDITRYEAPAGQSSEAERPKDTEPNSEVDTNALFDDLEDDENCISLEKIKAPYRNESEEQAPGSPGSSGMGPTSAEPLVPLTEPQGPFQPSSTPSHFEPRCLCYNSIGVVRYYDADKTVDVQFHDTLFHHALFLRSFGVCTMATLSKSVLCLAVPAMDDNKSKFSCLPLSSWTRNTEWTVHMAENEDVTAVAAGANWVAVATSGNLLRIFTHAGTQKQIVSLPGPVVCMSGFEQKILVVCHMGIGMFENQNMGFILYKISNLSVRVLTPFQPLPLFPQSLLKWIGFTDEGTPCSLDSEGLLRLLGHDNLHWEVVCDFRNQLKSSSDHYFVIGLSEKYQNVRCVHCRNSQYPLFINMPTVLEVPLKLPLCSLESEKSLLEETYWRLMFSLQSLEKVSADNSDCQGEIFNFEQTLKRTALKLFAEACRNSEDLRALDVATLMSSQPLEMAIKYASKVGKMYLADKLNGIKPVDWKTQYLECDNSLSSSPENHSNASKTLCSQQDLFEDFSVTREKENRPVNETVREREQSGPLETPKEPPLNPFKKVQPQKSEGAKGLKFLDSMKTTDVPKISKPVPLNKPLKLKPLTSSKGKAAEPKTKKPTFVQWFSVKKAALSEEYPDVSGSELTKLGMKRYKEEMYQSNIENQAEVSESSSSESKKRALDEENESEAKRSKGDDEF